MNTSFLPVHLTACFLLILTGFASAQSTLSNPSFEDQRADATMPSGWWSCEKGTTPDILPDFWGVYNLPRHGQSYVGLITREDGSFEAIGQRLSSTLEKGQCYEMRLYLSHSKVYAGYNTPIRLSIYLGEKKCGMDQLVFQSKIMGEEAWQLQELTFKPKSAGMKYVTLVANDDGRHINGNILIDHISDIRNCQRAMETGQESSSRRF